MAYFLRKILKRQLEDSAIGAPDPSAFYEIPRVVGGKCDFFFGKLHLCVGSKAIRKLAEKKIPEEQQTPEPKNRSHDSAHDLRPPNDLRKGKIFTSQSSLSPILHEREKRGPISKPPEFSASLREI